MKKNFKYFIFVLLAMVFGVFKVYAGVEVSTSKDLVHVKASSPAASAIYWNTSSSFNSAKNITGLGSFSASNGYISVKNGTYYFWAINTSGGKTLAGPYKVTSSCNDTTKLDVKSTDPFKVERCYLKKSNGADPVSESNVKIASCGDGYYLDQSKTKVTTNECNGMTLQHGVKQRYCKVVFQFQCAKKGGGSQEDPPKPTVPAATLDSLYVSQGTLSPNFHKNTKSYSVNVPSNVDSVSIDADPSSGSSFVNGSGPRSVNLSYGSNKVQIKVKNSAGNVTTYTININREDGRSTINSLATLVLSEGTLEPEFNPGTTTYNVKVMNNVTELKIDATLTDPKSSFVEGFGPRTQNLELGTNNVLVKVNNERGETNVYNINVVRDDLPAECVTQVETKALLKGINLSVDIDDIDLDQIENFEPQTKVYNVSVPYRVTSLTVQGFTQEEEDTVEVTGAEDFEVNIPKEVSVMVKSKMCTNYTNIYTLNVTRQPEKTADENPELQDLIIVNHDEFEFEPNKLDYDIVLNKGEDHLEFEYHPVSGNKTTCEAQGNEDLQLRSTISIVCTAEDKETAVTYTISVKDIKKGMSKFFVVILIILFILVLVYLVLRLLGYKIYFNFEVIGAFFRGIGEKIRNIFS